MQYIFWTILTMLFYVVCYLAVLNLIDEITKNSYLKIPAMLSASVPGAFLMAILEYQPIFLFAFIIFTNYYRVKQILAPNNPNKKFNGLKLNPILFFSASYFYILLLCSLAYYFQRPVELGEISIPLWKTWIQK